ncbi:MAG: protein kinase, partial [archaeon]|nr:protein kinase [archaeon]
MGSNFCGCTHKSSENKKDNKNSNDNDAPKKTETTEEEYDKVILLSTEDQTKSEEKKKFTKRPSKFLSSNTYFGIDKAVIIGKAYGNPLEVYEVGTQLGAGAFGQVFQVRHKQTGNISAMKVIKKSEGTLDKLETEDLNREINLLRSLDHQNIVKIYEFYEGNKNYYILTEYCEGGNLLDKIKSEGPMDEIKAGLIMFQLFGAIRYCHANKIMHRDLKPENIMIENKTKNGMIHIKIIDFGTAIFSEKKFKDQHIVGTRYYIAPEATKLNYSDKCDLWSLGVILFTMLTGCFPFNLKKYDYESLSKAKVNYESEHLRERSKEVKDLLKKLFKVNPDERISAEKALEDPWFKKNKIKEKLSNLSVESMRILLNNINNYRPKKVLQQAAIAYLVHNNPQIKEVQDARALYVKIDKNNDGKISKEEFYKGLTFLFNEQKQAVDKKHISDLFDIIDADGSNDLENEEFARAAVDKTKLLDENILKYAFNYFDKKKQGVICLDDVKEIFKKNITFSDDDFQAIIDEVDKNGDGVIQFEEFKEMMKAILS